MFSSEQSQILNGLMLGDGFLYKKNKISNTILRVARSLKDINYLKYEMRIFGDFLANRFKNGPLVYKRLDKRTNKIYKECYFCLCANKDLNEYHEKWYKNNIKIIPKDLMLTPITIAHWFCDDGSIYTNKLPYRFVIEFATQGFSKTENIFLAKLLKSIYQEDFIIQRKKEYFIIRAYDSASRKLIKDIDNFVPTEISRKRIWENTNSRFYNDQPDKQIERIKIFAKRKDIILDFLKNNNKPFSLRDLEKLLNIKYLRFSHALSYLENFMKENIITHSKIKNYHIFSITDLGAEKLKKY